MHLGARHFISQVLDLPLREGSHRGVRFFRGGGRRRQITSHLGLVIFSGIRLCARLWLGGRCHLLTQFILRREGPGPLVGASRAARVRRGGRVFWSDGRPRAGVRRGAGKRLGAFGGAGTSRLEYRPESLSLRLSLVLESQEELPACLRTAPWRWGLFAKPGLRDAPSISALAVNTAGQGIQATAEIWHGRRSFERR